jgi:hypothetical protein
VTKRYGILDHPGSLRSPPLLYQEGIGSETLSPTRIRFPVSVDGIRVLVASL